MTTAAAGAGTGDAGAAGAGAAGAGAAAGTGTGAGAGAGAGAAVAPWHGSADPATADYVKNKGWSNPGDVIKSYQGAERLIGRDPNSLLTMPRADDPAGVRGVLSKLGLPETADKYEFSAPEGFEHDPGFVKWAGETYHKAGLLPGQVKEITAAHNKYITEQLKTRDESYKVAVHNDRQTLLKEWGGGHERKMLAASSAAQALGFSAEMIDAIERTVGYAGTWKFFADLGSKLSEDSFVGSGSGKGPAFNTGITPAEAQAQIAAMAADQNIVKSLQDPMHPQHKANTEKRKSLFKAAYPQ